MEKGVFRFKEFRCRHYGSSMRIGVDAVLIGAWADVTGRRILDVGTGCGVVALMCAQRNPLASVEAVDIHEPSVSEAAGNFADSPWAPRLSARVIDFMRMERGEGYDLIVSNPPYFKSGVDPEESVRMSARHEGTLSPGVLLRHGRELLAENGRISMVVPYLRVEELLDAAGKCGLYLHRRLDVRGNSLADFKRTLMEFGRDERPVAVGEMTLETAPSVPTEEYREMCKNFYLYF